MGRNTLKAGCRAQDFGFAWPQLIGFLFVFLCPLALCIYYSMTAKSGGFSGLANYRDLWNSGTFRAGAGQYVPIFGRRRSSSGRDFFSPFGRVPSPAFVFPAGKSNGWQSGLITPMVIPSAVIILFCQIFLDAGGVLNQWTGSKTLYLQQSPYAFWVLIGPVFVEKLRLLHGDSAVRPGWYRPRPI